MRHYLLQILEEEGDYIGIPTIVTFTKKYIGKITENTL